jgi:hypothetical protein
MVESAIHRYLTDQLTDEGFKESILLILKEFKGKNLLHQNIGQLAWRMEKENSNVYANSKLEKIWILFDEVNPRIRKDFDLRIRKAES